MANFYRVSTEYKVLSKECKSINANQGLDFKN